jgi:hypothetical protein
MLGPYTTTTDRKEMFNRKEKIKINTTFFKLCMFCGDTCYDKLIIGQRVTHRGILELEILSSLKSTQQILKYNLYFFVATYFGLNLSIIGPLQD